MLLFALFMTALVTTGTAMAQSADTIAQPHRAVVASRVYHLIKTYFPDLDEPQFEHDYSEYVTAILNGSDDRRAFDLRTMALVASLHDGHSWFYDNWLDETHGQSTGLTVYRLSGRWVVMRSPVMAIKPGAVITAIDGVATDTFFQSRRAYLSASSERDATTSLFDTPVVFPDRFVVTLADGQQVAIDRTHDTQTSPAPTIDGRWLVPNTIGYVRMGAFHGLETIGDVWHLFTQFHDAKTVILDLRGNVGGGDPRGLQAALMAKPYPMWSEQEAVSGGALLRGYGVSHPGMEHIRVSDAEIRPFRGASFTGRLIILIDRGCSCACEDFTMPFKVTARAQLVGEATAGTFALTNLTEFGNGMRLNISAIRHSFPDGSRFEGIGIVPDVSVEPTPDQIQAGRDVVLERATALARS